MSKLANITVHCYADHVLFSLITFSLFICVCAAEKFEAEVAERVTSWTSKQKKKRQEVRTLNVNFNHILNLNAKKDSVLVLHRHYLCRDIDAAYHAI